MAKELSGWFDASLESGRIIVEATDVCKAYGRIPVLFPISLAVGSGEGTALLGPNGSGKSTLLRILSGATSPVSGEVTVCGYPLDEARRSALKHIGFAGHDTYLYDEMTGAENLRFYCALSGQRLRDVELFDALEVVGMRKAAADRVRSYSAGMKRRLCLARILLLQPDLILLDEPHASLDAQGQALVDTIVEAALASNRGVIIASHDHERVLSLCQGVIVLDGGRVVFQGDAESWRGRTAVWVVEKAEG